MIGIPELDRLSTDVILKIINGEIRIKVRDPRKIQTSIEYIPEPQLIDPNFMDDDKVTTLLKMEIESRAGWAWVSEQIKKSAVEEVVTNHV